METKYDSPFVYHFDDPEYEHLVMFGGALVPVAHIKLIGGVEPWMGMAVDDDGSKTPLYGFAVMLTDSNYEVLPLENRQMLHESWDTEKEAKEQRRNLALQVDNYYKKLLGK